MARIMQWARQELATGLDMIVSTPTEPLGVNEPVTAGRKNGAIFNQTKENIEKSLRPTAIFPRTYATVPEYKPKVEH